MTFAFRRPRGFTLIEVSVVVLLLAMFAALTVPRLASFKRGNDLREFRMKLAKLVAQAKATSMESGSNCILRYEESGDRFELARMSPEADETVIETLPLPGEVQISSSRSGGQDSGVNWEATFYPDGSATDGGVRIDWGDSEESLVIDGRTATATWSSEDIPDPSTTRWQAGELEQRMAGN